MRRASKFAVIALVGLPMFGLFAFPILYFMIYSYIDYLTLSNPYQIRKIDTNDFDNFEPDVTTDSFHPVTEDELLRYPEVKTSTEYFEGKRVSSDLTNAQVHCDVYPSECITYFAIKRVESVEFEQTVGFERCYGLFEHNQNYYMMSCVVATDPPSHYFDGYSYGFWMIVIGMPVIVIVWVFHRGQAQGSKRIAAQRSD